MHETAKLDSFAIDFAFQRILEAKIFEQGKKKLPVRARTCKYLAFKRF